MSNTLAADERGIFVANFNKFCFKFRHTLHRNDMFALENLVELSKRLPDSYYSTTDDSIGGNWSEGRKKQRSLSETVASIGESNSLVRLKGLATDPEFGPICREILSELEDNVGDVLRSDVCESRATVDISSPGRVTPYHIDPEVNFLFQLSGEKILNIFDQSDRTILTDAELEAFFGGDLNAAKYKKDQQGEARVYNFVPGDGLHLPLLAPHWTLNGDSISVAISINYRLRSYERTAKIYKLNNKLRGRGLVPLPPGISAWQDRLKVAVATGAELGQRGSFRKRLKFLGRS